MTIGFVIVSKGATKGIEGLVEEEQYEEEFKINRVVSHYNTAKGLAMQKIEKHGRKINANIFEIEEEEFFGSNFRYKVKGIYYSWVDCVKTKR